MQRLIAHSRPWLTSADLAAVAERLSTGMIAEGTLTSELERRLAAEFGFAHAIAVGSGCQALALALRSIGGASSRTVCVPTYVCGEVLGVIEAAGGIAAIADIGEDYLLDPNDEVLERTAVDVVVLPSVLGIMADRSRYSTIKPPIIGDWAQFMPSRAMRQSCEADCVILSFEATKVVAAGEGGAILVQDLDLATRIRRSKEVPGSNYKLNLYPMSDLHSSLVMSQLDRFFTMLELRSSIAHRYKEAFQHVCRNIVLPATTKSMHFRFPIQLPEHDGRLDDVIAAFAARGIAVRRPVAELLHHFRPQSRRFPVAERLFSQTLSLPIYPALENEAVERVIAAALAILR